MQSRFLELPITFLEAPARLADMTPTVCRDYSIWELRSADLQIKKCAPLKIGADLINQLKEDLYGESRGCTLRLLQNEISTSGLVRIALVRTSDVDTKVALTWK